MKNMADIAPVIESMGEELVRLRRDIHAHPEMGMELPRTAGIVADYLESLGIETTRNVGRFGVLGFMGGKEKGPVIAIRADMDALPIQENSDVFYRSKVSGVMHACGHDGHTATLLGLATVLSRIRDRIRGGIRFIFQPGEEKEGGANYMIEDGCLEGVEEIYGFHLWNPKPFGWVGSISGPIMASSKMITITVHGVGGHGAIPQDTVDALVVASQLVSGLQTIVSRNVDPLEKAVITLGRINGGEAHNVIASRVEMKGTMRTFSPEVADLLQRRINELCRGMEMAYGARIEVRFGKGYPPLVNDKKIYERWVKSAGKIVTGTVEEMTPIMGCEDFSAYAQRIPACYFFVGSSPPGVKAGEIAHHAANFDFDERAMTVALAILHQLAIDRLVG